MLFETSRKEIEVIIHDLLSSGMFLPFCYLYVNVKLLNGCEFMSLKIIKQSGWDGGGRQVQV